MSDSSNSFGEALESMTTNTKKALGGTIADFKNSVKSQVAGSNQSGLSGSFTPNLSGGDLFSPDLAQKSQQTPTPGVKGPSTPGVTSSTAQSSDAKTPEEMAQMDKIKAELAQMQQAKQQGHREYFQDFEAKSHGRDRNSQIAVEEKKEEKKQEEMEDLQKKQTKQQADDASLKRAQQNVENKGGGLG